MYDICTHFLSVTVTQTYVLVNLQPCGTVISPLTDKTYSVRPFRRLYFKSWIKGFCKEESQAVWEKSQTGSGGCANVLQLLKANPYWQS